MMRDSRTDNSLSWIIQQVNPMSLLGYTTGPENYQGMESKESSFVFIAQKSD